VVPGVTVVLQWVPGLPIVLQWWGNCLTTMFVLQWCYSGVTVVLPCCYSVGTVYHGCLSISTALTTHTLTHTQTHTHKHAHTHRIHTGIYDIPSAARVLQECCKGPIDALLKPTVGVRPSPPPSLHAHTHTQTVGDCPSPPPSPRSVGSECDNSVTVVLPWRYCGATMVLQ
jgi:hypothetical protein